MVRPFLPKASQHHPAVQSRLLSCAAHARSDYSERECARTPPSQHSGAAVRSRPRRFANDCRSLSDRAYLPSRARY